MKNLATLVLIGAITLQEAQAYKCPFSKMLEHMSEHKRHFFNWGKLYWPNAEVEEMKAHPIDAFLDMFSPGYFKREMHKCPVMSWLFGLDHKIIQEEKEHHDSPFYELKSPDDIPFNGTPTAVFHGLGDACIFGGMR